MCTYSRTLVKAHKRVLKSGWARTRFLWNRFSLVVDIPLFESGEVLIVLEGVIS